MTKAINYRNIFRWQQKDGWCGPAVIQMALAAGGIRTAQAIIARKVFQSWWGTNQQSIYAYLSQYFKHLGFKEGAYLKHVKYHLDRKHIVIVNWWDDYDKEDADGHYTLVVKVDLKTKRIHLADPAKGNGFWSLTTNDFNKRWYDILDIHGKKWIDGWMLWLDPHSRIK
jgi:ABC-type bacteriocin/lantibiotic exporter with double-glycine peptidase domain